MEPLWSPVVATGGKRWQIELARTAPEQAKTVAVGCEQLRETSDGKGRVDPTSLLLKRGSPFSLRKNVEARESGEPAGITDSNKPAVAMWSRSSRRRPR